MGPVSVTTSIDQPRDAVFAYLEDLANHPEFCDHFLKDWRMLGLDTAGRGAGARFKVDAPLNRFSWGELRLVEVEAPRRIVAHGTGGKNGRIRSRLVWLLEAGSAQTTDVTLTIETRPKLPSDKVMEFVGGAGWFKRKARRAVKRLRRVMEEGKGRGARATVAGG